MASSSIRFTPERRERFLTLIEAGETIAAACADVDISRTTINKWAVRGRAGGLANEEAEAFAKRFDAVQQGIAERERMNEEQLIELLEKAARRGSVQACRLLLERPWEKKRGDQDDPTDDEFGKLDELAPRREARG